MSAADGPQAGPHRLLVGPHLAGRRGAEGRALEHGRWRTYHYDVTCGITWSAERRRQLPRDTARADAHHGGVRARAPATLTDDQAYDASTGVLRRYRPGTRAGRGAGRTRSGRRTAGQALSPASTSAPRCAPCRPPARSASKTTVIDGRPAWTMTCSQIAPALASGSADRRGWPTYKVTTDKRTWLPVRFQQVEQGVLTTDLRYLQRPRQRAAAEGRVHAATAEGQRSRGTRTGGSGASPWTRPGPHGRHAARARLRADRLPPGARGRRASCADRQPPRSGHGHIFELQYTHGFDALTVSTRKVADAVLLGGRRSRGLLRLRLVRLSCARRPGSRPAPSPATTACIVVATQSSAPHLWAVKDGVLLTIAGGATAEELLAVADSLQVYPGAAPD